MNDLPDLPAWLLTAAIGLFIVTAAVVLIRELWRGGRRRPEVGDDTLAMLAQPSAQDTEREIAALHAELDRFDELGRPE